jgi:phosphodiesterase/alkaline phosphatase D-like protein
VALAVLPGRELFAASSFGDNPFTLGVASGDPTPDGIVLWTRLAPDPVDAGRLGHRTIPYNPHIKYYEGDRRGYFKATVTPKQMRLDLRFVTSVEHTLGTGYAEATWVIRDGILRR